MIIFDVMNTVHSLDESITYDASKIKRAFDEIRRETNAALLILHHFRKESATSSSRGNQMLRGSTVFAGWLESALYLRPIPGGRNQVHVEPESKWASIEPFSFRIEVVNDAGADSDWKPLSAQLVYQGDSKLLEDTRLEAVFKGICRNYEEFGLLGCTAKRLVDVAGMTENTVRKYAAKLVEKKRIKMGSVTTATGDVAACFTPVEQDSGGSAANEAA
jgi:hypothetical protein